ncbi:MAG: hypothetical protein ACLPJH_00295 [Myxococcaceae bacterium]
MVKANNWNTPNELVKTIDHVERVLGYVDEALERAGRARKLP